VILNNLANHSKRSIFWPCLDFEQPLTRTPGGSHTPNHGAHPPAVGSSQRHAAQAACHFTKRAGSRRASRTPCREAGQLPRGLAVASTVCNPQDRRNRQNRPV